MMFSKRFLALSLIAATTLSACISILPEPKPAPNIYRLTEVQMNEGVVEGHATILIRRPSAPLALQGVDIPVSPDGRRLAYAEGARWETPIPQIVQQVLVDGFSNSAEFKPVLGNAGVSPHYALSVSIRHFEAEYDNGDDAAPLARVTLTATLTDTQSRGLIGNKTVSSTRRSSANQLGDIVRAQEQALREAVGQFVDWAENSTAARPKVQ